MAREAPPSPPAGSSRYSDEHPTALSATPLSLNFEELSGDVLVDDPTAQKNTTMSKASQLLSSLTGSQQSYDLVEDDEYEDNLVTPRVELRDNPTTHEALQRRESEDAPVRTASISRQLPLNHPRPDLQSLQGAYIKNVERLEESAERLSMTSSLEGELQRMKMEQRRTERTASASSQAESYKSRLRQFSSTSNSIIDMNAAARSGGYSGYISSPIGSIKSPNMGQGAFPSRHSSRSSRRNYGLTEPEMEGRPLEFGSNVSHSDAASLDPRPPPSRSVSNASNIDRPGTSGSGDTFQQANTLFNDFDGVHYDADSFEGRHRQVSITRPPRARDSRAFREPQPGEDMVYYPAPVPVLLNLPVRLSRMNWNDRERKRLQALSEMPEDSRRSAAWLAHESNVGPANRQSMAKLPPQLRASAFFDHRGMEQNVQLKDGSAVATLDSILDAAAHAPVSAFTDHPIVGHLGKEVYGKSPRKSVQLQSETKSKRRSSISNLLARKSSGNLSTEMSRHGRLGSADGLDRDVRTRDGDDDDEAVRSIAPTSDELLDDDDDENGENAEAHGSESEEDDTRPGFSVAPTTLLAELQMRKTQQKKRNRTAADGFPNGMHSTLLELDTVTQLQQKARKQKHVTLAWEDQEVADKENYDDEDVPLGLLFTEKQRQDHINLNRPIGLLEKREMEENEPLSMRRARLRGEPFIPPAPLSGAQSLVVASQHGDIEGPPTIDLPTQDESEGEEADETLAQRMKRIRDRKEGGSDFARDVNSELGLNPIESEVQPSKTPDVEETLGQRRKRLKEEALRNGGRQVSAESADAAARPALKPSRSLADVLQSHPIGYQHPQASKTSLAAMQSYQQTHKNSPGYIAGQQASAMPTPPNVMQMPHGNYMHTPSLGYPAYQYQNGMTPYMNAGMYNTIPGYGAQVSTNMNMNMGMNTMAYPYGVPGFAQNPAAFGMGPPLDQKQRATIDRWRQGIA